MKSLITIIKLILINVIDKLEDKITDKGSKATKLSFATSIFSTLMWYVLSQMGGVKDELISFATNQVLQVSIKIVNKVSKVMASLMSIFIIGGLVFLAFIFLTIGMALFIGDLLGNYIYGFFVTSLLILVMAGLMYYYGHRAMAKNIKKHLETLIDDD
ncbi:MAG: hypothetical protein WAU01_17515 [Saprospiraceae bacterium]